MKAIKTLILVVLLAAIGICGYLIYQENFGQQPQETEQVDPQVTQVNDSTYHINLSDCSCVMLEKIGDTLYVDANGVNFIHANSKNDSIQFIRIGTLQTYVIDYHDFFDSIKEIKVNFPE